LEGQIAVSNPLHGLQRGVEILNPVLVPNGFKFKMGACGSGSGGPFASGMFQKQKRALEIHVRFSLGLVTYLFDDAPLDHVTYMRFLGAHGRNRYPNFSEDIGEQFEALTSDLREFCSEFISGSGEQFNKFAQQYAMNPRMFKGLHVTDL
jgi:hypothetical protein